MLTTRPKTRFGLPQALLPHWLGAPAHVWGYPPLLPSLLARFGRASPLPCARFGWPSTHIFLVLRHFFSLPVPSSSSFIVGHHPRLVIGDWYLRSTLPCLFIYSRKVDTTFR